jgi:hypothetical protein
MHTQKVHVSDHLKDHDLNFSSSLVVKHMPAMLYHPYAIPQPISDNGLWTPGSTTEFTGIQDRVPELLNCTPELVDVLATGTGYIVYSIFDYEGEINMSAMKAVSVLTNILFDTGNQDDVLRGPILIVLTETLMQLSFQDFSIIK